MYRGQCVWPSADAFAIHLRDEKPPASALSTITPSFPYFFFPSR